MNLKKRIFVTLPFCTFRLFYFLLMISAVSKRLKYRGSGAAKEVVAEINKKKKLINFKEEDRSLDQSYEMRHRSRNHARVYVRSSRDHAINLRTA